MRVLVLDTSTPAVTAALVEVGPAPSEPAELPAAAPVDLLARVLAEVVVVDARRHGELLAVGVREVLDGSAGGVGAVGAVVAGVGPGPFTGLRVGIVTAAVLADALGVPALGVCSLDGLSGPGTAAVTDARRREVYWARYDGTGSRVDGPRVGSPAVAAESVRTADRVVGDGALRYAEAFAGLDVQQEPRYPVAARLAEVAVRRHLAGEPALPLTPLYLRRPDAEQPRPPKRVTP